MGDPFYQHDSDHLSSGLDPPQRPATLSHGSTGHILGPGGGQASNVAHTSADGAGGHYAHWDTQGVHQSQQMYKVAQQYYGHGGYPQTPAYQTPGGGYVQYGYDQYGQQYVPPPEMQVWYGPGGYGPGDPTQHPTAASAASGGSQDAARRQLFPSTFLQRQQSAAPHPDGAVGMPQLHGGGGGAP
jgi:hypothetical protein